MQADDVVIFTPEHYDVLVGYELIHTGVARIVSSRGRVTYLKPDHRDEIRGRVLAAGDGWAKVLWLKTGRTTSHFTDNLELVNGRRPGR